MAAPEPLRTHGANGRCTPVPPAQGLRTRDDLVYAQPTPEGRRLGWDGSLRRDPSAVRRLAGPALAVASACRSPAGRQKGACPRPRQGFAFRGRAPRQDRLPDSAPQMDRRFRISKPSPRRKPRLGAPTGARIQNCRMKRFASSPPLLLLLPRSPGIAIAEPELHLDSNSELS